MLKISRQVKNFSCHVATGDYESVPIPETEISFRNYHTLCKMLRAFSFEKALYFAIDLNVY